MFRGKVVGAALRGRPEETAGAGALSAKHEEIPLGYPRPTVNSQTNFPLSIFDYLYPPGCLLSLIRHGYAVPPSPLGRLPSGLLVCGNKFNYAADEHSYARS